MPELVICVFNDKPDKRGIILPPSLIENFKPVKLPLLMDFDYSKVIDEVEVYKKGQSLCMDLKNNMFKNAKLPLSMGFKVLQKTVVDEKIEVNQFEPLSVSFVTRY